MMNALKRQVKAEEKEEQQQQKKQPKRRRTTTIETIKKTKQYRPKSAIGTKSREMEKEMLKRNAKILQNVREYSKQQQEIEQTKEVVNKIKEANKKRKDMLNNYFNNNNNKKTKIEPFKEEEKEETRPATVMGVRGKEEKQPYLKKHTGIISRRSSTVSDARIIPAWMIVEKEPPMHQSPHSHFEDYEMEYHSLVDEMVSLWNLLDIPNWQRRPYIKRINDITEENVDMVEVEVERLQKIERAAEMTLNHIKNREACLDELFHLTIHFDHMIKKPKDIDEEQITGILNRVEDLSRAIDYRKMNINYSIKQWRKLFGKRKAIFYWNNQNYQKKMKMDMIFYIDSLLHQYTIHLGTLQNKKEALAFILGEKGEEEDENLVREQALYNSTETSSVHLSNTSLHSSEEEEQQLIKKEEEEESIKEEKLYPHTPNLPQLDIEETLIDEPVVETTKQSEEKPIMNQPKMKRINKQQSPPKMSGRSSNSKLKGINIEASVASFVRHSTIHHNRRLLNNMMGNPLGRSKARRVLTDQERHEQIRRASMMNRSKRNVDRIVALNNKKGDDNSMYSKMEEMEEVKHKGIVIAHEQRASMIDNYATFYKQTVGFPIKLMTNEANLVLQKFARMALAIRFIKERGEPQMTRGKHNFSLVQLELFHREPRYGEAALAIQCCWRAYLAYRLFMKRRAFVNMWTLKRARTFLGVTVKNFSYDPRFQHFMAVLRLQLVFRHRLAQKKYAEQVALDQLEHQSALQIQLAYRCHVARCCYRKRQKEMNAILSVQSTLKRDMESITFHCDVERINLVKSQLRGYATKQHYQLLKDEYALAKHSISNRLRSSLGMKKRASEQVLQEMPIQQMTTTTRKKKKGFFSFLSRSKKKSS